MTTGDSNTGIGGYYEAAPVNNSSPAPSSPGTMPVFVKTPKFAPVKIMAPSNTLDFEQRKAQIFASVDRNSNQIHDSLESTINLKAVSNSLDDPINVIVAVRDGALDSAISYFESLGGSMIRRLEGAFYGIAGEIPARCINDLALFGDVELVEEDQQMVRYMDTATQLTNVRTYVWDTLGYTGDPNSAIAILDTGVDDSHTMLSPYASLDFANGKIVGWFDATADGSTSPEDQNSHGSHCAGIAAGKEYDAQLPDGRIKSTWGIKYSLTSSASGFFTYYIQVKAQGTVDIMTIWSGTTNVGSSEVRLVAPNGTIMDSVVSTDSQRNLTAFADANSIGVWAVKIQVSYPTTGGEFRAVGINVYPYDSPGDSHGRFSGVAPDTKIVGVKVFDNTGSGSSTDLIDGLNWVYNNAQTYHITVASMSLGFSSTVASVDTATANLVSKGVITVVAAGNDGQGANNINTPGHVNEIICVAASGDHNKITDYSSEGPGQLNTMKPDLAAPGGVSTQGAILSVDSNDQEADGAFTEQQPNDMAIMQGTSMATPYVAGLAALLVDAMGGYSGWTYDSSAGPYTVKQILMMTSYEIGTINRGDKDTVEGYGRVNADAALEAYLYEHTIGTAENATIVSGDIGRKAWARHMTLTSGTTYTFDLDVPDGADFDLFLYDGAYDTYGEPILLAKSINFAPGASEHITFSPSSTGTYYLVVKYVSGNGGTFTLSSSSGTTFPTVSLVTPTDNAELTGTLTVQVSASGTGLSSVAVRFWNDTWIDITSNYNSGSGYYEYAMNVTCLESGNVTFIARATNSAGASYDSSSVWVQTATPQILLVDDDTGAAYESYYKDALASLGYVEGTNYDVWTVSVSGSPSATKLQSYGIVIWFTSDDYQTTLTSTDQSNLGTFLSNGGKLFISGQDIGYDANTNGWETWLQNNLHGDFITDDTDGVTVNGVSGDPVFGNASYSLGGGDGGGNNGYPDEISAMPDSVQGMQYDVSGTPGAAVYYNGTYRVVYFGFNFEAISYAADRTDVLGRVLNFLGVDTPPTLKVSQPTRNSWVSSPFDIIFNTSDDVSQPYVDIYLDGQWKARTTNGSVAISSDEGYHTLRVLAFDSIGQVTIKQIIIRVDNTAPVVTFVTPSAGAVVKNGTTVDVSVTDDYLDWVLFKWDSGSWQNFSPPYDTVIPSGEGTHTLYVQASDLAGNLVNTSQQYVCDDTAPSVALVTPSDGSVEHSGTTIDLSITDDHLQEVYYHWDSDSWTILSSPYDTSLPSGDGSHTLYINATDEAGNYRFVSYSFTTDDTAPTITLISPANDTVQPGGTTVDLNVSDLHLGTVYYRWDSNSWSILSSPYDTQIPMDNGTHILYVNATDAAGNNVMQTYVWSVESSGSAPLIQLVSPTNTSVQVSGTLIDLDITDSDGDLSTVYYHWDTNGWAVLSAPYDTTLPIGDGTHVLYVNATDSAGLYTVKVYEFTTDDIAPIVSLVSPSDNSVISSGTTIDLDITDANNISLSLYSWDGGSNVSLSSPFDITVSGLSEGSHTLDVYSKDEAGNWIHVAYSFVVDDTVPVITLNNPANGTEIGSGVTIDLDVSDAHIVTIVYYNWNSGFNSSLSSPYDIDTSGLSEGVYTLNVYAQDEAGNWGTAIYSFIIDNTAPTITMVSPSNGSEIQSGTIVSLNIIDTNTLFQTLYNWDGSPNSTLVDPYDISTAGLSEGTHLLNVYAGDNAGNWGIMNYTLIIDDTCPVIILNSPPSGAEIKPGTTIDLDVTDSNTVEQVLYNWNSGSNTTLVSPYDVSTTGLSDGVYILVVFACDLAGNWANNTYTFVIDSVAPVVFLNSPADMSVIQSGTVIDLSVTDNNTLQNVYYQWDGGINNTLVTPFDVSTSGLSEGNHTLVIYATDTAGNWRTTTFSFVIDDTVPVILLVSPANESVFISGTSIDLDVTDSNTVAQVFYNWDETINVTLPSPYIINATGLSEGIHLLYVYAEDVAGNIAFSTYCFTVDDTPPSIILVAPPDGSEIQSSVTIDLSISDANLDYVQYQWDGGVIFNLTSPFDITVAGLSEGYHYLTVFSYDLAQHNTTVNYSFIVDDTAPVILLLSPAAGAEIKSGTVVSLDISDSNTLVSTLYSWDGGSNSTLDASYEVSTNGLSEGSHTLHVYAYDAAGNVQHSTYSFIIDDRAPLITLESPSDGAEIQSGTTIDLTVSDVNTLTTVLFAWDSNSNTSLSSPYDVSTTGFSEGSHTLNVFACDSAGNWAKSTFVYIIDDTAPVISLNSPSDGAEIQSGTTIDLGITDGNTLLDVLYSWDGNTNTSLGSPYDVSTSGLSEESHTLEVYARDSAGNWVKTIYSFVIDDTAPVISLNSPSDGAEIQSGTTIDLGITDGNSIIEVLYNWDDTANISLSEPYDIDTTGLVENAHSLHVFARDSAGNWAHSQYTFVIDDSAPIIQLLSPANESIIATGTIIDLDVYDMNTLSLVQYLWDSGTMTTLNSPFDIAVTDLAEGLHDLDVYATDAAGNSIHVRFVFTIDDSSPVITLIGPANGSVLQSGVTVEVSITDDHLSSVRYHWDGDSWISWSTPYQTTTPSGDGMHILYVEATDAAGHTTNIHISYEVDDTVPIISLNGPANYTRHHSGYLVDVSVSDSNLATVYYRWDSDTWSLWSAPYDTYLPVGDGEHILYVNATDTAGNKQHVRYVFISDDATPFVVLHSPNNQTVQLSGTLVNVSITDDDIDTVLYHWDSAGWSSWAYPFDTIVPTIDGPHILYIFVNDTAGNEESLQYLFVTDDSIPEVVLLSPLNTTVHTSGFIVNLNVTDDHLLNVTIQWDGGTWTALPDPFDTSLPSGDGVHVLVVNATDVVGNNRIVQFVFVVDDTAPTVELLTPENSTLHQSGILVNVSIIDANGFTAEFSWDGGIWQLWNYPYETILPSTDGEHLLSVRVTDEAGNLNESMFVLYVDDTPPLVVLDSPTNNTVQLSGSLVQFSVSDEHLDGVLISWDGGSWITVTSPFTTTIPSGSGPHTLRINASDAVGNSVMVECHFIVDDVAPVVSLISPSNFTVLRSGTDIELSVSDDNLNYVRVRWDNGSWISVTAPFIIQMPLTDGLHILEVEAVDDVLNTATLRLAFITDDTPPTLSHPDDVEYTEGTLGHVVEWIAEDPHPFNYTVFIDGILYDNGLWTTESPISVSIDGLLVGEYVLTIVVVDTAGNSVSDTVNIVVNASGTTSSDSTTTGPTPTETSPTGTISPVPDILGIRFEVFIIMIGAGLGIVVVVVVVFLRKSASSK